MRDSTMAVEIAIVASLLGVAGCAAVHASQPSASIPVERSARDVPTVAGDWSGVITGTELSSAEGQKAASAALHVSADDTWTATTRFGASTATSAGTVRRVGNHVVLDGTIVGGDPKLVGKPVAFDLIRRRSGLFGLADTYFYGEPMRVPMMLRKTG